MTRKAFLFSMAGGASATFSGGCTREPLGSGAPSVASSAASSGAGSAAAAGASKSEELAGVVVEHVNAAYYVAAAYIGDRLGLLRAMSGAGPLTARQLSEKAGFNERYTLEWLRTMAAAGYVDYHPEPGSFELAAEQAAVLVDEESPFFTAGLVAGTVPDVLMVPRVMAAFRSGKGISYADYPPDVFDAIERITKPDYRHLLTQQWLPAVPGVVERLRAGGTAADLGSGAGLASIAIAKAFPRAQAVGFEPYAPSVARARDNALAAGVAGRVRFDTFDGVHVPGGPYDLITMNYALHHAGNPVALLGSARQALAGRGALLVVEYRKSARLEEDIQTLRGGIYGIGLLECLPTALAAGGPGYGTGITEPDVRELAESTGFSEFARVLPEDPMRSLFVLRG